MLFSDTASFSTDAQGYDFIEWKVTGYNFCKTFDTKTLKLKDLNTGQYMITCYVTYADTTIGKSKIIRVKKLQLPQLQAPATLQQDVDFLFIQSG